MREDLRQLELPHIADFTVTGRPDAGPWPGLEWCALAELGERRAGYRTRFKAAWSELGIYVLIDCEDSLLACSGRLADFEDLYREDVVELFLWPDPCYPLYLECEVSPLEKELVLLVANSAGGFMGWRPWHYEGTRLIKKAVCVRGGERAPHAAVSGWSAELFVPFALMQGFVAGAPAAGACWRANVCRIDYDQPPRALWAWSPVSGGTFHSPAEFGEWRFVRV